MTLRRLIAVAALAVLAAGLLEAEPLEPGRTRVMSFNIRYGGADDGDDSWRHRRFLVRLAIRQKWPDLIGLQECLDFQADELDRAFREYDLVGHGRDDGKRAGEMCALMVRSSRFELIEYGSFWLSDTPDTPGRLGWDAACPRIVTWARLRDRFCRPDTFVFASAHLDHVGETARRESARLIRERLAAVADGAPVILAGDFNARGGTSEPWNVLCADGGWRDTWLVAGDPADPAGTFHGFDGIDDGRGRIDWILATPHWETEAADIVRYGRDGRWPSDHYPITADFRLEWIPGVEIPDGMTGATP